MVASCWVRPGLPNMLLNRKHDQAEQVLNPAHQSSLSHHQLQDMGLGKYIIIWIDFWDSFLMTGAKIVL
jgi:hypothetical protein